MSVAVDEKVEGGGRRGRRRRRKRRMRGRRKRKKKKKIKRWEEDKEEGLVITNVALAILNFSIPSFVPPVFRIKM